LEYGVLIQDKIVNEIKLDYLAVFDNTEYPEITLDIIEKANDILRSVPLEKRKTISVTDKALFEELINEENIEERFDGGHVSILSNLSPWKKDVFKCLLEPDKDNFTLEEVYSCESRLSQLHPNNRNVRAKIRQQLQYLRDTGLVEFIRPGMYKKL